MSVQIVRFTAGMVDQLDQIAEDVFDDRVDPVRLSAFASADAQMMVLAIVDGVVVGQARAVIHRQPDEAAALYVDNLGVTPKRQREGIGLRLMQALSAWGRERGCEHAWVATEIENQPAVGLYRRLGAQGRTIAYFEFDLAADPARA